MRSRTERTVLTISALAVVAAAAAAWSTQDQWLPHARPWSHMIWKKLTRPGPESLPPDKRPPGSQARSTRGTASEPVAPQPRKCVKDGRTVYIDQPCPKGSQELTVDGAVTSLPQ